MTFSPYESGESRKHLKGKPCAWVTVEFHTPEKNSFRWPGVLDTGSIYTLLPGEGGDFETEEEANTALFKPLAVKLVNFEKHSSDLPGSLELPRRSMGRKAVVRRLRSIDGPERFHVPCEAYLDVNGFEGLDLQVVYLHPKIDHVILGWLLLKQFHGICLRNTCYRPGRCWLQPREFFR